MHSGFSEFVVEHEGRLLRTAFLLTGDGAEDLLQSALAAAHRNWPRLRAAADPVAEVRRLLVSTILARPVATAEVLGAPVQPPAGVAAPDRTLDRALDRALDQALDRALDRLAPQVRAVLVLRFAEGLSVEATADVLGCAPALVRSEAATGLAALRPVLAPQPVPGPFPAPDAAPPAGTSSGPDDAADPDRIYRRPAAAPGSPAAPDRRAAPGPAAAGPAAPGPAARGPAARPAPVARSAHPDLVAGPVTDAGSAADADPWSIYRRPA